MEFEGVKKPFRHGYAVPPPLLGEANELRRTMAAQPPKGISKGNASPWTVQRGKGESKEGLGERSDSPLVLLGLRSKTKVFAK